MNALKLYHDLKKRDIRLEADGVNLKVNAPVGTLSNEDRAALKDAKPILISFLSRATEKPARKSEARWAGSGWIRILDPDTNEWHEVKAFECLPGVVAEANRRKRGSRA